MFQNENLRGFLTKILNLLLHQITLNFLQEYGNRLKLKFNGSCLKQDKITFNHGKIVNIYIVYEINNNNNKNSNYPTLKNCLFGAVSLTKNTDIVSISTLDMELDLMDMDLIHIQVVEMEEMQFLEQI